MTTKKFGNWMFKSNLTFEFRSDRYRYEVDCERSTVKGWLCHLQETKSLVMSSGDLEDLARGFAWLKESMPTLPVFTNRDEAYLAHRTAKVARLIDIANGGI
jgi:hypothetical protein